MPNFHSDFLFHPQYEMGDFQWLAAPFMLASHAQPRALYLATFVIAVLAYVFLPVIVLFSAYFTQLVALERHAQILKRQA